MHYNIITLLPVYQNNLHLNKYTQYIQRKLQKLIYKSYDNLCNESLHLQHPKTDPQITPSGFL